MGFPNWTLWGMGLSAIGALFAMALAFMAQSPHFLSRARLGRLRLDLRARLFTGYALAMMLLAGGFFLAGVPIGTQPGSVTRDQPEAQVTTVSDTSSIATSTPIETGLGETAVPTNQETSQTPQSGAFSGPPPTSETDSAGPAPDESPAAERTAAPSPTATPSPRPTTTPTSTPTPSPTVTPTPTLTPTPIDGETAVINTGTSTLWVRRTPGGSSLVLVRGGDTIILMPGHANQGGILWQEVMALDGSVGWVQEEFVTKDEGEE